ncbi:hypothetical protein ADICYQ_4350 [Cyclobacterium qasimii M12-11B]|uniref:Uncharacterized protein n=1 Tax=Cyclobacterium qasimii M12-11B TaxID=641524 RepID=S7WR37_9BACT|nr:hypothetical protein ADICYQ_4350 [Cyclobacterium qasimii M12-11B]
MLLMGNRGTIPHFYFFRLRDMRSERIGFSPKMDVVLVKDFGLSTIVFIKSHFVNY